MFKNNDGKVWNWNVTNTILVIAFLALAGIIAWLASGVRMNSENVGDVNAKAEVNSKVVGIIAGDIPAIRIQVASIDNRLIRLEAHFGTLPSKEIKMGKVMIEWKIRSAMMTGYGTVMRVPGDQDAMELQKARDLAKCGIVKILGRPKDVVDSAAEAVEDET